MTWAVEPDAAARAVQRALHLLQVLDRKHTDEEAHRVMRAVRHELETAAGRLPDVGDVWSERILRRARPDQPDMFA